MSLLMHDPLPPKIHDPELNWYLKEADDIADTLCGFSLQGRKVQLEMMQHIYKRLNKQMGYSLANAEEEAKRQREYYELLQANYREFAELFQQHPIQ